MSSMIGDTVLFLSRRLEFSIAIKATLILVLGLAAAWLAGRSRASVRHLLLVATFGALLLLPLIVVTAPGVTIGVPAPHGGDPVSAVGSAASANGARSSSAGSRPSEGDQSPSLPWLEVVRMTWIIGAVLLLLPLAVDGWRLGRLRRYSLPCQELRPRLQSLVAACRVRRHVDVVLHDVIPAPVTCGVVRHTILLPRDAPGWSENELRCALVHELEHVRRSDFPIQLIVRAICACYWFHPLVWVASRWICREAERACDDAVIQHEEPAEYAGQLVSLARRISTSHLQPAIGMANRSDLSIRVSALLDSSQPRGRAGRLATVAALTAASVVLLAVAPLRAVAQSNNPDSRDRALFEAARSGDAGDIERSLAAGANPNALLRGDGSPLIGAAREGHLAAVRLLLDRGADPNLPARGDGNPLIMAAREGHAEVVTLLLDRGAIIDQMVPDDENALIQASARGHLDVVKLLVARRADVNARVWVDRPFEGNGEWRTPLSMAQKGGHDAVVAFLRSAGARE